jgi:hypothetical protein
MLSFTALTEDMPAARAYIETPTTCDAFVTRGVISEQPQATLEVTSERWETIA